MKPCVLLTISILLFISFKTNGQERSTGVPVQTPLDIPTITGPDTACAGMGGYNYFTEAGMSDYIWTISSGGTINSGDGTNSVFVTWDTPGLNSISVNYNSSPSPAVFPVNVFSGASPGIWISVSANPSCLNQPVTFTASPTNEGPNPFYQWKVNNISVGMNTPTMTMMPLNGDVIRCQLTSNQPCVTMNPVFSNTIFMIVNPTPVVINNPLSMMLCSNSPTNIILAANFPGSTFTWTCTSSSPNVVGFSDGSGSIISQYLMNLGNIPESIIYHITPTLNGCSGPVTDYVVTVLPFPSITNTPMSKQICSGSSTNISLTSNVAGTTFYWSATGSSPNISGYSQGSGSLINQSLINSGFTIETVTYHLTPVANGCNGPAADYTVTIYPGSNVYFNPSSQSICSGQMTNIQILSNIPGTSFTWTATPSSPNLAGFSPGTGNLIQQTLINPGSLPETVTYTVTPSANGCTGMSGHLIVTINPTNSVFITASANPFCQGTAVTFTATPSIPGGAIYQWEVNGMNVGNNSATYTYYPVDGDIITCSATFSPGCGPSTVESNPISMVAAFALPVSVTISASANPTCQGTTITFTATPVNPGSAPVYQWKINGGNVGSNSTMLIYTPINGDIITCTLQSTAPCTSGNPATSNAITMSVVPQQTIGVTISASENPFCTGSPVTFTAMPSNGGTAPVFQWRVNGFLVGTNSTTYVYTPVNADSITCLMTSNQGCITGPNPVTSNRIIMSSATGLPVSINIIASLNPVCQGTLVVYTATIVNGGSYPLYQWKVNGESVGVNSNIFQYIPTNGDILSCTLTSNLTCTNGNSATSNFITMNVYPQEPVSISITASANPFCQGTVVDFTAMASNEGTSPIFRWRINGINVPAANSPNFSCTPGNGDVIYCRLTSNATCASGNPANSNAITMIASSTPVSVAITASANPVCEGTPVTFTATPVNPGNSPYYNWFLCGNIVSASGPVFSYFPSNGDVISCSLTSSAECASGNPAMSNPVTVTVIQRPTAGFSGTGTICSGTSTNITLSSDIPGTSFSWTASSTSPGVTGFSPGTGNMIFQVLFNTGGYPGIVDYTVTPTANGCTGPAIHVIDTVFPGPDIIFTPPNTYILSGQTTNILLSSTVPGTTFYWTSSSSSANVTGYSQGAGTLIQQTLYNSGNTIEQVFYMVTPSSHGCIASPSLYIVQVSPDIQTPVTYAGSTAGETSLPTLVPVTVDHLTNIGSISLRLEYNPSRAVFDSATNINPLLGTVIVNDVHINDTLHKVMMVWSDITPVTLPSGSKILDLVFTYLNGVAVLSWNNAANNSSDCEYTDATGNALPDTPTSFFYHDGVIQPGLDISGHYLYNNSANTPLDSLWVLLKHNGTGVDSTRTDLSGYFLFSGTGSGIYTISAWSGKPWNGNNGSDALKVQRHFTGLELLTEPVRIAAADVNNTGSVNGTDALKIKRRFVGLDTSFPKGDWIFGKTGTGGDSIILANASISQSFYGLCVGDVNGSFIPSTGGKSGPVLSLEESGEINIAAGMEFQIPIYLKDPNEIGAYSLVLAFPEYALEFMDASSAKGVVIKNSQHGELRLAWSEVDPLISSREDPFAILNFRVKQMDVNPVISLNLMPGSEIADPMAEPLNDAVIYYPHINVQREINVPTGAGIRLLSIYPNPATDQLTLSYEIATATTVDINLASSAGALVLHQQYNDPTGKCVRQINVSSLPEGIYFIRIRAEGDDSAGIMSKVVLMR